VNIQSHLQFDSHLLNRDTWTHETMESVLRTTFLFWQRGHTSGDGINYMRMHKLTVDDLPHIGIIDPRTGAKLVTLTVRVVFVFGG
jgi:UBX domain-containing protein 7